MRRVIQGHRLVRWGIPILLAVSSAALPAYLATVVAGPSGTALAGSPSGPVGTPATVPASAGPKDVPPQTSLSLPAAATPVTYSSAAGAASQPDARSILVPSTQPGRTTTIEEWHTTRDLDLAGSLRILSKYTRDNVVMSSKVDPTQKVEVNLYDVTFDQALDAILSPLGLTYKRSGSFVYVYTVKELEEQGKQRGVVSTVFKLHYVTAVDAGVLLKPLLSTVGQMSATAAASAGIDSAAAAGSGGASSGGAGGGSSTTGGNSYATEDALVVSDYPENLKVIAQVLADLDVRPRQVLVEATIIQATLNEDNALGIDFNTLGGINFSQLQDASASGTGSTSGTGSGSGSTTIAQYPNSSSTVNGNLARSSFNKTTFNANTDLLQSFTPGGFSFGFVSGNVAAFVRALESVTDANVVANPKVLALNKQKGEVIIGNRDGYLTSIITETSNTQQIQFLETGVKLSFRPYIGDAGYVRMELHPEVSDGQVKITTAGALPSESTTAVTTNLLVKDGHTIVIGGLIKENTSSSRTQVPWLGNLPGAGLLFRTRSDSTVRSETIILLTVHIIENNQAYAEAGEKALEDVERIRVGLRQDLMPWGRERLAQAHYKWALEHIEAGRIDKGLWDLDMALSLAPRFYDAIAKKEELTHRRAWEANDSIVRNFIYNRALGAEDKWIDTMGPPPPEPLTPPPDRDSSEWGTPVRSMKGPNAGVTKP